MASKRPSYDLSLDDEVARFHQAIGEAMSAWAWIEYRVCRIFGLALMTQNAASSNAAFYSVVNFRTKLDMTDAALRHCDGIEDARAEWGALYVKLGRASQQRAPLAHYSVAQWPQARPGDRVFLVRPMLDNDTKSKPLNYNNVAHRLASFLQLGIEAEDVALKIQALPRRPSSIFSSLERGDLPASMERIAHSDFPKDVSNKDS